MATVRIEFSTDNAAFEAAYALELENIFLQTRGALGDYLDGSEKAFTLRDSNGNTVGRVEVTE